MAEEKRGRGNWDGRRIRELRDAKRLSQEDLAQLSGVNKSDISRHERNDPKSNPSVDALARIAEALGIPLSSLFEPVGTTTRPEGKSGHAEQQRTAISGHPGLERLLAEIDQEFPAEDSIEGDIHKAIAALNRALRRRRTPATVARTAEKTGR